MRRSPPDSSPAISARVRVGTKRYSRAELAEMRTGVRLLFDEPGDAEFESLVRLFERVQGRHVKRSVHGYLIRLWRIHGPQTEQVLRDQYRERGTDQNLLLALELAPPAWLDDEVTDEGARAPDGHPGAADRGCARRDEVGKDDVHAASGYEQGDVPLFDPAGTLPTTERQEPGRFAAARPEQTIWRCAVGRDHVQRTRPDGSRYCATCHP